MPNKPLPPLNPATMEPIGPEMLLPLFPEELIKQEVTPKKFVEIPGEIREANRCKEEGVTKNILIHLCGHGYFDLKAYNDYMSGKLIDHDLSDTEIRQSLDKLKTPAMI